MELCRHAWVKKDGISTGLSWERKVTSVSRARLVLQDAMHVRQKLEDETSALEWRLGWVLAVVLLRAVGHVLAKVDGDADPAVASVVKVCFTEWKSGAEHSIFQDFIEKERNSILKEYNAGITEGSVDVMTAVQSSCGFQFTSHASLEDNIYRPLTDGPFAGEDGRTILDYAIDWWVAQLAEVDRQVVSLRQASRGPGRSSSD